MRKFIDMFCGIGSFGKELTATGKFECVTACDNNKWVKSTYLLNHDMNKMYFANDIGKLNDLLEERRGEDYQRLYECDLLCAGIPCQSFSLMGKKEALSNTTTLNLINEFMRMVDILRPKVVLLENVKQFKTQAFEPILEPFLRANGYNSIDTTVLNCRYYGIPQNRERFFAIASRLPPEELDIKNFLEFDRVDTPSLKNYLGLDGNPVRDYSICIRTAGYSKQYDRRNFLTLLSVDGEGENDIIHLTLDHIKRLQGFEDLVFPEKCPKNEKHKMLGNTIPTNLTRLLADRLTERLS